MSKFAYGPATWHVLASDGPPISPHHFYSTTYSTVHGRQGNGDTHRGGVRHKYVLFFNHRDTLQDIIIMMNSAWLLISMISSH